MCQRKPPLVLRHNVVNLGRLRWPVAYPMTLDLLATLHVVDDDVSAIVEAYMANSDIGAVAFGEGFRIDPAAAIAEHPFARTLMGQPWASDELRRASVRAAILLARPERS